MSKYIILPDVTCDLSKELRDYFGLEDYIMGYVQINGNITIEFMKSIESTKYTQQEFNEIETLPFIPNTP